MPSVDEMMGLVHRFGQFRPETSMKPIGRGVDKHSPEPDGEGYQTTHHHGAELCYSSLPPPTPHPLPRAMTARLPPPTSTPFDSNSVPPALPSGSLPATT